MSSPTSTSAAPPDAGRPSPGAAGVRPGLVLLLSAGATFIAFLDTTVVNVAFPDLARSFPADRVSDLSWVVSSYAVLFAALLTPAGRIADTFGRKRLFLSSLAGFTLTSALCACAPDLPWLITARALQGATAAGMIPAALGLLLATTPPQRLPAAIGAWGAAGSLATAAGPALGGILVDAFGWRAVFLINVPVGAALVLAGVRGLPERSGAQRQLPDPLGTLAVTAGIALLVLGLTKGSDWGWAEAATVGCVAGGAALIAVALLRSARHAAPAVETALFRNRTFTVASVAAAFTGAALFGWLLSSPLFLTTVWHYSVLKAGFAVTPGALTSAVAAVAVGKRAKPQPTARGGRGVHGRVRRRERVGLRGPGFRHPLPVAVAAHGPDRRRVLRRRTDGAVDRRRQVPAAAAVRLGRRHDHHRPAVGRLAGRGGHRVGARRARGRRAAGVPRRLPDLRPGGRGRRTGGPGHGPHPGEGVLT
ncbi:MFS transporter [Actinacidiphila bryophytorum]|uniref:Major facilitator superfamily (MFS) profile domain-containing protein n=1 Tax=Actinacidiphila bryophytorum TaxID=1436133 RepID=A0A9W4H870_9ACTN|nr:MFS transporter [Actinacidiphila bryophytorum]MBM9437889.1 MFS transporter [Actinacidiphila bryophytorum]MBN6542718.1 MFS transporter [Actinacidiphila bryophytorum]CAG7657304.1 membrane hypothetical protein [Actinacidiphila bryophytorum]